MHGAVAMLLLVRVLAPWDFVVCRYDRDLFQKKSVTLGMEGACERDDGNVRLHREHG
jgi:hypothetical protein